MPGRGAIATAVDRSIACGMTFYTAVAVLQIAALLGVAYWALPEHGLRGQSYELIVKLLVAPGRDGPLLRLLGGGFERAPSRPAVRFHAAARAFQHHRAVRWCWPSASSPESIFSWWSPLRPRSRSGSDLFRVSG